MKICIHGFGIAAIATWFRLREQGQEPYFSVGTKIRDQGHIASNQSTCLIHGSPTNPKHLELLSKYNALLKELGLDDLGLNPFEIYRNGEKISEEYAIIPFAKIRDQVRKVALFAPPGEGVQVWATGSETQTTPFAWLPLKPARGVWIRLKRPRFLQFDRAYRHRVTLIVEKETVLIGATVRWDHLFDSVSPLEITELREKASEIVPELIDAELVDFGFGIRPASYDRFPLVGAHPDTRDHYVINGLGSLGFSKAFEASKILLETLKNPAIEHAYKVKRCFKKYYLA